jgi:hypothetical protein
MSKRIADRLCDHLGRGVGRHGSREAIRRRFAEACTVGHEERPSHGGCHHYQRMRLEVAEQDH